jgi:predicted GIY-YIG superfamily endonuclease
MNHIKLANKYQYKTFGYDRLWCVYLLHFGEAFYIGATNKLTRRIQAHNSTINAVLSGRNHPQSRLYTKALSYIKENGIIEYTFSIYAYCNGKNEAYLAESFLLRKYFGSQLCVNQGNISILHNC